MQAVQLSDWLSNHFSDLIFLDWIRLDTDDCAQCTKTLEELENIDDDCDRHGITFVKTKDFSVAEQFGVHDFPALVYFESSIPNVFEGEFHPSWEFHILFNLILNKWHCIPL